ncbi:MAG: hypothetical protein IRY99_17105 [Isosphaeraceae bacterium]|nr:hypothetical protein [Isosphaeraceae bacterium]
MIRLAILPLALLWPLATRAQEPDARKLAQEILDKGAALFDTRDAAAMAATYTEDAKIFWVGKNQDTGQYQIDVKDGRSQIEDLYRNLFKDRKRTTSRNTVEFARFVAPDLLVIQGYFEPDIHRADKFPFVQVRVKQGDKWLMMSLRLFVLPKD